LSYQEEHAAIGLLSTFLLRLRYLSNLFDFCFFLFFKKTPFVLPKTKVKSCRAWFLFLLSTFINENRRFSHDFLLYCLFLLLFSEKMATQKTKKKTFSFIFIFIKTKGLHYFPFH